MNLELLSILLIESLEASEEGKIIQQRINIATSKIIENCDNTDIISIYLEIVKSYKRHDTLSKISNLGILCLKRIIQVILHCYIKILEPP